MSDAVWLAAVVALTLFGAWASRVELVRRVELPGRLALLFACGLVTAGAVMSLLTIVHLRWERLTLAIPLVAAAFLWRRGERVPIRWQTWIVLGITTVLTAYGALTSRQTIGDLLFFWAPKAVRFYEAGGIDFEFLQSPDYFLMHSDYPPLLPMIYAAGIVAAHRMSYWSALLFSSVCILAAAMAFRGIARTRVGERRSAAFASLLAALLAYGITTANAAGGADALVYFFFAVAVAALAFTDDRLIAAVALAGLVLTKVEGLAYAIVIVGAYFVTQRRLVHTLAIGAAPLAAIGAWIVAVYHFRIADAYTIGREPMRLDHLRDVVRWVARTASYRAMYLPWLAALAPLAFARNLRRAAFPLLVAAGAAAATCVFYLKGDESPEWWIAASAERVLLTPLVALVIAAAASSPDESVC